MSQRDGILASHLDLKDVGDVRVQYGDLEPREHTCTCISVTY